jgi:hypothetical protein
MDSGHAMAQQAGISWRMDSLRVVIGIVMFNYGE